MGILENFFQSLRPNTERVYRQALRQYEVFSRGGRDATELLRFLNHLKRTGKSDNTRRLYFAALRSIFGYECDIGALGKNPALEIRRAVSLRQCRQVRPTATIPTELVRSIIEAPQGDSWKAIRARGCLALLFGGGLRRSELLALNIEDVIATSSGRLALLLRHTKAGTSQHRALPSWAWEHHAELVALRRKQGAAEGDPLVVTRYRGAWRRMFERTLARLFSRYARLVLKRHAAPHAARAAFATRLLEAGCSDRDVARALGHSTTQQVGVYDKRRREADDSPARDIQY